MKLLEKLDDWWHRYTMVNGHRKLLIGACFVWFFFLLLVYGYLSPDCLVGALLMVLAVTAHDKGWSVYVFLVAVFLVLNAHPVTMVILLGVVAYMVYKILNVYRVRLAERIARMTPEALSGVRYQDPAVEIVVQGGKRS